MSFDNVEGLIEKITPFDTFAQIIDGRSEIVIDGLTEEEIRIVEGKLMRNFVN